MRRGNQAEVFSVNLFQNLKNKIIVRGVFLVVIDFGETEKLINIALATVHIDEIKTPYNYNVRPSMHIILYGRIGSIKSTILNDVCKHFDKQPLLNITSSMILGSVDKNTGIPTLPEIWENRNSILPIDEFYLNKGDYQLRKALNNLLSVLENPYFRKSIGYRCNNYEDVDNDLFIKIVDNKIICKTKFVLFLNTMMDLTKYRRMVELEALKTRCLVIPNYPSLEDLKRIANGQVVYTYKKYKVKKKVKIPKKDYDNMIKLLESNKIPAQDFMRTLGDLCRCYAVVGFDMETFNIILKLKKKNK